MCVLIFMSFGYNLVLWYELNKKFWDILLYFPIPFHVNRKPTWRSRVWWLAKLAWYNVTWKTLYCAFVILLAICYDASTKHQFMRDCKLSSLSLSSFYHSYPYRTLIHPGAMVMIIMLHYYTKPVSFAFYRNRYVSRTNKKQTGMTWKCLRFSGLWRWPQRK